MNSPDPIQRQRDARLERIRAYDRGDATSQACGLAEQLAEECAVLRQLCGRAAEIAYGTIPGDFKELVSSLESAAAGLPIGDSP